MFQPDEYIVYGTNGVCRITEVCASPFDASDKRLYYVMKPLSDASNSLIYTPVDNTAVPMRALMTREELESLIDRIPSLPLLEIPIEKQRKEVYRAAMATVEPETYVRLLKTVYSRREAAREKRKRLSEMDNDYETMARRSLYSELALVLGIQGTEVESYLSARIGEASSQ